jgi:hypothetical protein
MVCLFFCSSESFKILGLPPEKKWRETLGRTPYWNMISWKTACTYQWPINTAMSDEDQVSSKWLKMLVYESCTTEMKEVLMLEYGNLDVCFRGGVTFVWMLCNKVFGLNHDTTAALVNFLKLFWNKDLRCYQGENLALARKELLAVCSCLAKAKELPQETPVDLLTGLTLCFVDEFKTLFEHKLHRWQRRSHWREIIICPTLRSWEKYTFWWHLQLSTTTVLT